MIAALIFLATGIGLLFITFKIYKVYLNYRRLKENGMKANGVVKDFEIIEGKNSKTYFPIVQFRTYSSMEIIGKPISGYKEKDYQSSLKEVEVIYLESDPKIFIIQGQKFDYFILIVFVVMILSYPFMIWTMAKSHPYWVNDLKQFLDKF
jgi:hypothetical protein